MADQVETRELIPAEKKERLGEVVAHMAGMQEIVVTNDSEQENAAALLTDLKGWKKELVASRQELTGDLKAQVKEIESTYRPVVQSIENMIDKTGDAVGLYQAEVERKRREEEERKEAEAEAARKREAERAEKAIDKAAELREAGKDEQADKQEAKAEAHLSAAEETVAEVPEERKPTGTSFTGYYEAKVTDRVQAIPAMMANPIVAECVTIDLKNLCKLQQATKGKIEIPGITFTRRLRPVSRGA